MRSSPDPLSEGKLPHTPRAKKVIAHSMEEAQFLNDEYVGTEHILLGLSRDRENVACLILLSFGLDLEGVREVVVGLQNRRLLEADDSAPSVLKLHTSRWRSFGQFLGSLVHRQT